MREARRGLCYIISHFIIMFSVVNFTIMDVYCIQSFGIGSFPLDSFDNQAELSNIACRKMSPYELSSV